jgi:hypothetical protein
MSNERTTQFTQLRKQLETKWLDAEDESRALEENVQDTFDVVKSWKKESKAFDEFIAARELEKESRRVDEAGVVGVVEERVREFNERLEFSHEKQAQQAQQAQQSISLVAKAKQLLSTVLLILFVRNVFDI